MHSHTAYFCALLFVSFHAPSTLLSHTEVIETKGTPHVASVLDDLATLRAELLEHRDQADEILIAQLADLQTREAMEALLEVYDSMASIWMRSEVVRALSRFDKVENAFQPALEKVMNVATNATEPELRAVALEALGDAPKHGKTFLALIVNSPARDDVRIEAMRQHVRLATADDVAWYRAEYERKEAKPSTKSTPRSRRSEEALKVPIIPYLPEIKRLAIEQLLLSLTDIELFGVFRDNRSLAIKRVALAELHGRENVDAAELARELLKRIDTPGVFRAFCAEIVTDIDGPKVLKEFLSYAKKQNVTQQVLRNKIADLLAEMDDPKVRKKIASLIGKGKPHEKAFALRATRNIHDKKIEASIRKGLRDRDPEVLMATLHAVGERKDQAAIKDLEKLLDKTKDTPVLETLLRTLSKIHGSHDEWVERLKGFADSEELNIRNAAIFELGRLQRRDLLKFFVKQLANSNWSTRLAAAKALEELRISESVGALVKRLPKESGRIAILLTKTLWRLTGKPFGNRSESWIAWWKNEGSDFSPIGEDELAKLELELVERNQRQISTVAQFFGIKIESERVIFIIDVSGSMIEPLRAKHVGEEGKPRMDIAKRELAKVIKALDPNTLFNILKFSSDMKRWRDEGIATPTESSRDNALEYIQGFIPSGGTNIHGALKLAFEDLDVDTIVMLSDGEPSMGDTTDPGRIRAAVADWNETRGIQIHTVAIGSSLLLMEWLAEDSGGQYVEFN
ncbi:MAG: HEAT repeat protein [Planctomycetota bacterium]|jgi:HEAT repeat protein